MNLWNVLCLLLGHQWRIAGLTIRRSRGLRCEVCDRCGKTRAVEGGMLP